jgi:hypothetical protein
MTRPESKFRLRVTRESGVTDFSPRGIRPILLKSDGRRTLTYYKRFPRFFVSFFDENAKRPDDSGRMRGTICEVRLIL